MARQKISFACKVLPVPSTEKNKYVAMASMDQLRQFLPNVDINKNYDLLPVAFQGFNVNMFNKNDDGIDSAGAVASYKSFIGKPINREHERTNTVGYIISATLTELNSNKEITEEEALAKKEPFNVTFGGVLWRLVDEGITEKVEESQDPDSENYGKIFASFEIGFDERDVVGIKEGRNLEDGVILEKSDYAPALRCLGGTGAKDGYRLFNLVKGELLGLGAALTTNPAAFVEPVATIPEVKEEITADIIDVKPPKIETNIEPMKTITVEVSLDQAKLKDLAAEIEATINPIVDKYISKAELTTKSVKERKSMKISKVEDLTDGVMQEVKASDVRTFLDEKIQEFAVKHQNDKIEADKQVLAEKQAKEALAAEHELLKTKTAQMEADLAQIKAEATARENQEKLNERMTSLEATYDLAAEDIQILIKKVTGLDDVGYVAFAAELEVLLKEKNKEYKKSKEVKATQSVQTLNNVVKDAQVATKAAGDAVAVLTASVIDSAIDNATQVNANIPNSGAPQLTLLDKMKAAFGGDNIKITL